MSVHPTQLMPIRVGVIGAGAIADVHLRALSANPHARVVAIADTRVDVALKRAATFGVSRVYADSSELLDDPMVDLVDILLPHNLHFPIASAALEAGKNVLCEKPIALSLADADALFACAARTGRRLFVKFYQRFMPFHRRMRDWIARGDLGTPYLATTFVASDRRSVLADPRNWRGSWRGCGGGVLMDTGIHLVDLLHFFFGDSLAVEGVCGRTADLPQEKAEDVCNAIIVFVGGVVASITCTWADTSLAFRWEKHIFGTRASMHLTDHGLDSSLVLSANGRITQRSYSTGAWERANQQAINHVIRCLQTGAPSLLTPESARRTLQTVLAVYEASRTGARIDLKTFCPADRTPDPSSVRVVAGRPSQDEAHTML